MPPKTRTKSPGGKKATTGVKPSVKPSMGKKTAAKPSKKSIETPKELTEETAVVIFQRFGRGFLSRMNTKGSYIKKGEEVLNKLEEEWEMKELEYDSKRREEEKKIKSERKSKDQLQAELQEQLFTAAFDGEIEDLLKSISNKADVHKQDAHDNYAVGEAAVNGQAEIIKILVQDHDADPNCKGAYGRTPIWRAAYNSHKDAISTLLKLGADPRVEAQSESAYDLVSGEAKQILSDWDVSITDSLLANLSNIKQQREEERLAKAKEIAVTLESDAEDAKSKYDSIQRQLCHSKQELERRIYEYDCVCHDPDKGDELRNIGLDLVHRAEAEVERLKQESNNREHQYLNSKSRLIQHSQQELSLEEPGHPTKLKHIVETVLCDAGGLYKESPKWPLIIDYSGRSSVFLQYRDTNYINTMHPHVMESNYLRRALIGSLRYGKALVLDLNNVPMLDNTVQAFERVEKGLWEKIITKEIFKSYRSLISPDDGREYEERNWSPSLMEDFVTVMLTSSRVIEQPLLDTFFAFRVETDF